jgi:anaerobic ribonucleoside-triphosphate reductase
MAKCGRECEIWSRPCGYFRPVANWNRGKKQEFKDRKTFKNPEENKENKNKE